MNVSGKRKSLFRILSLGSLIFIFLAMEAKAAPLEQEIEISQNAMGSESTEANIYQGNFEISGTLSYMNYDSRNTIGLNNRYEYFISDQFSLGGNINLYFNEYGQSFSFGPSLTYYFWKNEKWTSYVGQSLNWGEANFDYDDGYPSYYNSNFTGESRIGVKYFIIPEVAVGLEYNYEYVLGKGDRFLGNPNELQVSFSIHL